MTAYGIDGDRALEMIKRLGPARTGGSPDEKQAGLLLQKEIKALNLEPVEETFDILTFDNDSASVQVNKPFKQDLEAYAIGLSGQTPPEGIEAELIYAESGGLCYLSNIEGKIPLIYGRLNASKYNTLLREGAAGFICISEPGRPPFLNILERPWVDRWGHCPGALIGFDDGLKLIKEKTRRVRLQVQQRIYQGTSQNICVDIPGTKYPEEIILIGAHYDSHRAMDGAIDNGAGTVVQFELARFFATHPSKRTLRFVWFGCEEMGGLGSNEYVERHTEELEKIKLMLVFDLGGGIIGRDKVATAGPPEIKSFFQTMNLEKGLGMEISEMLFGSDNIPFNEAGIPAVSIYRDSGVAAYIHTRLDSLDLIDGPHLADHARMGAEFLDRIANAYEFPFARQVPESMLQEIKQKNVEYFGKVTK